MGPADPLPADPSPSSSQGQASVVLALTAIAVALLLVQPGKDILTRYIKTWFQAFMTMPYYAWIPIAAFGTGGLAVTILVALVASALGMSWRWVGEPLRNNARFRFHTMALVLKAKREMRRNPTQGTVLTAASAANLRQAQATPGQIAQLPPSPTGFYSLVERNGVPTLEPVS